MTQRLSSKTTQYILLQCGLSNRLRTIVGYWYLADKLGLKIIFHWDIADSACNGRWTDLFKSLTTPDNQNIHIFDTKRQNVSYAYIGQDVILDIILRHAPELVPKNTKRNDLWDSKYITDIENQYYARFRIKPEITDAVDRFFRVNGGGNLSDFVAMHIRRTDHIELAKKFNSYTSFGEFDKFITDNPNKKIFLATDSIDVQKKYKSRCIFNKEIPYMSVSNLRQTTLQDALIDILIAARCSKFKGSGFSSYSGLIDIMHRVWLFKK